MKVGKTIASTVYGYRAVPVQVEADNLSGNFGIQIVGLPDHTGREAKERIRSAIMNSGFEFPPFFNIINLSPNDLPKEGALLEMAAATALLVASGQLPQEFFEDKMILGSLSLDGSVHPSRGIMASAILAMQMENIHSVILPSASLEEVAAIPGLKVYPVRSLSDLETIIREDIRPVTNIPFDVPAREVVTDMSEITGQEKAKNALAYSAIGYHHVLMIGSPGTGKSMMARAMAGILPPLTLEESLEVTAIHSLAGLSRNRLIQHPPVRSPHHTSSDIALVGGGSSPSPGEVSLSHRGVLFLDELSEFKNSTLQTLREPMEEEKITISRAKAVATFPANFILLGAMNPCACGYLLSKKNHCHCRPASIQRIYQKIQGPFLDRIAMEVETEENYEWENNVISHPEKDSGWWMDKIIEARLRMMARNDGKKNKNLSNEDIHFWLNRWTQSGVVPHSVHSLIRELSLKNKLSHRGWTNTLRLSFSIMDFLEKDHIDEDILLEAFSYRRINHITALLSKFAA